jgi:hypothetical protein
MAKRRKPAKPEPPPPSSGEASDLAALFAAAAPAESQVFTGSLSLHDMFQNEVRATLDKTDLDEDAKQAILVAMSCPCCGAGSMNYTVPIKRRT